jgi:acetolactate synthase I/II/III large subunit
MIKNLSKLIGLTGSEIVHRFVGKYTKTVFGYPGGAILPIFDTIFNSKRFRFIRPVHEQGGCHMAEGYSKAKLYKEPGVVLVTSGPGATNAVTGIQDALMDHIPLVVISGQVHRHRIGTVAFQEAAVESITKSATKWNYTVMDDTTLPYALDKAFNIALTPPYGPTLIDIPKDIQENIYNGGIPIDKKNSIVFENWDGNNLNEFKSEIKNDTINDKKVNDELSKNLDAIEKILYQLNTAKRPIICCGGGATYDAWRYVRKLSEKCSIPVTTSLHGLGCFNENNHLSLGMLGMHGMVYANYAVQNADFILGVGSRLDDRVTGKESEFGRCANIATIDASQKYTDINKNKLNNISIDIVGDASVYMKTIVDRVNKYNIRDSYSKYNTNNESRDEWISQINEWKEKYPLNYHNDGTDRLTGPKVLHSLNKFVDDNTIITTGVGRHQMLAAQYINYTKPGQLITSGGLGTMGFGIPAAIGAKLAQPDKTVICVDGDGSFLMSAIEIITAVKEGINIKIILLNDSSLGMVRQWQDIFYNGRHSHTTTDVNDRFNFYDLFFALGGTAKICNHPDYIDKTIEAVLKINRPVLLDCRISSTDVYPMVKPGSPIDNMII